MANPFEKRATEYLRDDEAFLAVVTPEPLATFFEKPAKEGKLFDRLAMIIGTPGSGKTTLARLFQFSTIQTLLRNEGLDNYKALISALAACGAIADGVPTLVGGRIPLEAEYREFWEFPYSEELKTGLMIALLQARTILAWIRNFQAAGIPIENISIIPRPNADAALTYIGGLAGADLLQKAREVELAIYKISAALMPPDVSEIDEGAATAYRPFDVIESFKVIDGEIVHIVRPLVIFDDAHSLHPQQLSNLRRWLARRELRVGRWILTRLDALTPADVLSNEESVAEEPGLKRTREITVIWLQSSEDRNTQRRSFRKMAKDMASRYLSQMDVFSRRRLTSLGDLLATEAVTIAPSKRADLGKRVDSLQKKYAITADRRRSLEEQVDDYLKSGAESGEDMRLAMLAILFERYANRIPKRDLFEASEYSDPEPNRPLSADSGVADGAAVYLMHKYDRPYYYGIDTLCDASSENAEQFLQLASRLVSQSETQLIRAKSATLPSGLQHTLLRERAAEIVREWDFPHLQQVRRLAEGIGAWCQEKSLEGNASLKGGASAIGIPQDEFDAIPKTNKDLARVLQFGVAYNVFVLAPNHSAKKRTWCLIELSGVLLLHYGLTLKRGGFVEGTTADLVRLVGEI
jgi:hypothetical protein